MVKNQKLMLALLLTLTVTVMLSGCGGDGPPSQTAAPESTAVPAAETVDEPENEPVFAQPSLTVLADGEVRNGRPVLPLAFETTGQLLTLTVEPGQVVAAGDVIATLDDEALRNQVQSAELRVSQSENNLLQAKGELLRLQRWAPDEGAVAIAEANIASAETNLANARSQDAVAGNGLTQAQISIDQAQRELADAQEQYDNAFSPGREWEVFYDEPICAPGQPPPCTGITYAERIKNDREISTARLQRAEEQLRIAQANYQVEAARVSGNSAVNANASLIAAQQELERALTGPTDEEIAAAELNVRNAELVLEQEQFALTQAEDALSRAELVAPWDGTILTVDATTGAFVGTGTPIVTLLDASQLEFHTSNLSERDLDQIEIGQAAVITLKAYPNDPIDGTVIRIGLQATGVLGDAAIFPVIISIDSAERPIRTGMTGQVEILRINNDE